MNEEKSADFLTYKELSDAVDTNSTESNYWTAAVFLMQAITDWPTFNLQEPSDLIEELRNEVKSQLTFDNLKALQKQLDTKDSAWKTESISSIIEMFDFERKNDFDNETELETIIKKLTEYYRQ